MVTEQAESGNATNAVMAQPGAAGMTPAQDPSAAIGEALELRDIHLPVEPGPWPPAPGWWALTGLLIAAFVVATVLARRAWLRMRRRRTILAELDRLTRSAVAGPPLAAGVSELLKRVALSRYRRSEVASLTGEAWLDFLDRTGGGDRFGRGPGRVLASAPYAPEMSSGANAELDQRGLLAAARDWVRRNT